MNGEHGIVDSVQECLSASVYMVLAGKDALNTITSNQYSRAQPVIFTKADKFWEKTHLCVLFLSHSE